VQWQGQNSVRRLRMKRDFDVIVFGATGFTGGLVAEYLNTTYGVGEEVAWAMAGRNLDKLAEVRREIGAPPTLALLTADASDPTAMAALVRQASVVITTVGPYQRHGQALVEACAQAGTDYVDLCGEPGWMAHMIPRLTAPAQASGARIVFSCGFDSIPFDLGVVFLQDEARRRFGAPLTQVRGRVRGMKGGISGGTIASALATIEAMGQDPALARLMSDPFALTPGFQGPKQPDGDAAAYDSMAKSWTGPFMMAAINTKNVHRTNALRGHPWGRDFLYDERMLTGRGTRGEWLAKARAGGTWVQNALLGFGPTRILLRDLALPKPGQGPGPRQRAAGSYDLRFSGEAADGRTLRASVKGDRDPGYGSTSKMISESALCLIHDIDRRTTGGGAWTPGAAMGLTLARRLQQRAGLRFAIEG
jgi:short subunit dehydrogenase-like uncharacterized protein